MTQLIQIIRSDYKAILVGVAWLLVAIGALYLAVDFKSFNFHGFLALLLLLALIGAMKLGTMGKITS